MADEVQIDPAILQRTQQVLGKYIQRPQLTEKLLKRPPFRFLHDIVTAAVNQYGIFPATFSSEELNAETIKDKEGKIKFLDKLIKATSSITKEELNVRASKIVSGSEAENTNHLLQSLAKVIEMSRKTKTSNSKENEKAKIEKAKKNEITKPTMNSIKKPVKPDSTPHISSVANSKHKTAKNEEAAQTKTSSREKKQTADSQSKVGKSVSTKPQGRTPSRVRETPRESKEKSRKTKDAEQELKENFQELKNESREVKESAELKEPEETFINEAETLLNAEETLLNSKTIEQSENEIPPESRELLGSADSGIAVDKSPFRASSAPRQTINSPERLELENDLSKEAFIPITNESNKGNKEDPEEEHSFEKLPVKLSSAVSRGFSSRPKSSRRPPSRTGKDRVSLDLTSTMVKGTVPNVVLEGNEEDEQEVEDQIVDSALIIDTPISANFTLTNNAEQGKLVEQILNAQKELSSAEDDGKTDPEDNEASAKGSAVILAEFERMKTLIQSAAKAAFPIGQLLPAVHEDIEMMLKEWTFWKNESSRLAQELETELSGDDPELVAMKSELSELENTVAVYKMKLNSVRADIYRG